MVRLGWIEVLSSCTLLFLFFSTMVRVSSVLVLMLGEVLSRYPFLSSRRPSIAPEVSHQHLGVMCASGKSDHPLVITRLTKWRCREWQNTVRTSKVWFKKRSPTSCLGIIATTKGIPMKVVGKTTKQRMKMKLILVLAIIIAIITIIVETWSSASGVRGRGRPFGTVVHSPVRALSLHHHCHHHRHEHHHCQHHPRDHNYCLIL